ncbi:hypothetical protein LguiB_006571 [Lonicera macranthoides]
MAIVRAQEASTSTFRYNYQVFLSFRGEDTRKTFTDHLYTALIQAGLHTFRDDDEIERGKGLESALHKAIQESRISIIVFSKNYASSKWCLNEVAMIFEWSNSSSGHEVLPVFYDVDPSDGTETIECLMLDMRNFMSSESSGEVDFNYDTFSRMERLRLLKLNYARLCGCSATFVEALRWLCWHGFPSKYIPFDLPLGNLVSLDMSNSKLEHIWVGNKVLLSLKILNLSNSLWLLETPNFNGLPNLERLIVVGCVSLFKVGDTIGNLERLVLLDLANCKSLRKFPNIGMLKLLQTLVLDGCSNIGEFPKNLKNVESLKTLNVDGATINPLTSIGRDHVKPILKNP